MSLADSSSHSPRRFWPSTVMLLLFLVSQGNMARIVGPLDPSFFAMQFAFTPTRFSAILAAWGPEGVARYRSHFVYDLVHPLLFGALGWVAVKTSPVFDGLSASKERLYRWMLPLAAGLDYIENTCQLKLLSWPPGTVDWLVPLSATCATLKWCMAAAFVVAFVERVIAWTRSWFAR